MPACMPAVTAEPALKPNQPTHSNEAPMKVSTILCPGPLSLRLPRQIAHIRPATPALICTTVPPAKSSTLNAASELPFDIKPSAPQTQCAIGAYTTIAQMPKKREIGGDLRAVGEAAAKQRGRDAGEGSWEAELNSSRNGPRQPVGCAGPV